MNRKLPILLSLLLVLALVLVACGDNNTANNTGVENNTEVEEDLGTEDDLGAEDTTDEATVGAQVGMDLNRVTNLLGHNVVGAADEDLGSIDSLLVDSQSGQIVYALIQAGEALEIENDLVAVPWSQLSIEEDTDVAMDMTGEEDEELGDDPAGTEVEVTEEVAEDVTDAEQAEATETQLVYTGDLATLQTAPSFTDEELGEGDILTMDLDTELADFWTNEVATLPQTGVNEAGIGLIRLENVEDKQLTNAEGQDLGDIEDMLLDRTQGMITHVIVATGGLLDIGEELIPVPFERFQFQPNEQDVNESDIILNVDQESLEAAPRIENLDAIPDTDVEGWDTEFNSYWDTLE